MRQCGVGAEARPIDERAATEEPGKHTHERRELREVLRPLADILADPPLTGDEGAPRLPRHVWMPVARVARRDEVEGNMKKGPVVFHFRSPRPGMDHVDREAHGRLRTRAQARDGGVGGRQRRE